MRVLIIDNFDSFTYNLYQKIGEIVFSNCSYKSLNDCLKVVRNNEVTLRQIEKYNPSHIVLSPGPGSPDNRDYFGICGEVILNFGKHTPVLGVCLGMQGVAYVFGASIVRSPFPMHGKTSRICHSNHGVFRDLQQHIKVMRYHSLMVDKTSIPDCLEVTAWVSGTDMELIMGIKHLVYPIEGIQFHPESFATEAGADILKNFLFEKAQGDRVVRVAGGSQLG